MMVQNRREFIRLLLVGILITAAILAIINRKKQGSAVIVNGEEVSLGAVASVSGEEEPEESFPVAPNFRLLDFRDRPVTLSDFRGTPVFIDFWAGWCPFCLHELPEIQKIHQEFGDRLVVLGIHRTETEDKTHGEAFAHARGVSYTLLQDQTGDVYRLYTKGYPAMPFALYIDREGRIRGRSLGPKTAVQMRAEITKIIQE